MCNFGWNEIDAAVICRLLFGNDAISARAIPISNGLDRIYSVDCDEDDNSISDSNTERIGNRYCRQNYGYAGVDCAEGKREIMLFLISPKITH